MPHVAMQSLLVLVFVLSLGVLVSLPVLFLSLRRNPQAVIRDQWQDLADPGCGWAVGIMVLLLAGLIAGSLFVITGRALFF